MELGGCRSRVQHTEKLPGKAEANALILLQNQANLVSVGQHTLEQRIVSKAALVEQPMRKGILLPHRLVRCDRSLVVIFFVSRRERLIRVGILLIALHRAGGILARQACLGPREGNRQVLLQPAVL